MNYIAHFIGHNLLLAKVDLIVSLVKHPPKVYKDFVEFWKDNFLYYINSKILHINRESIREFPPILFELLPNIT